ncbi:DUF2934 domain-containing protein [Stutzerimonas azotifigens]|uniref:DUF2934 domain-containing protein n=1 Tax=Stutzerimonas azotifigens TaxID=291995 RepID=UPI0003F9261F|nr:DUF2934 domain-containing protein [Stutzerimonas azotifigens]
MSAKEQRIRELAYQIWESEGCPEGEDARHWEMARKLADAEEGGTATKPATRARRTATKPTEAAPAAKPKTARSTRATTTAAATPAAPEGDTDAEAGTPKAIKKPRTTRAGKKES